jgi:cephalosporin-C deacetylase
MAFFDLPLEQLEIYKPDRNEPSDFDSFWKHTLNETRSHPINTRFEPVDAGLHALETFDVTFNGYGGQPIKGWFLKPRGASNLPCIVEFMGYGGGRATLANWSLYPSAGFALFVMDTRGQGSAWSSGDTPDPELEGGNPQFPGFMTRGILDPKTYYYRRVFSDAVRAVEAARTHPSVDTNRVAVTGGSQGGGITLAVAGLEPNLQAALPDVPFLCQYRRATEIVDSHPYGEIRHFLKIHRDKVDTVFQTLAYFDGINFAARAKAKTLFSVALMDQVCPPSTVYAAYNHYAAEKRIMVYPYNGHEGGESRHALERIKFLHEVLG